MTGILIGVAFLAGFGLGAAAVVVCIGLALLLRARGSLSTVAAAIVVVASVGGAVWAQTADAVNPVTFESGGFEGVAQVVDGPYLTQRGLRVVLQGDSTQGQRICAYGAASPRPIAGDTVFLSGSMTMPDDLSDIGRAALQARDCVAQLRVEQFVIVTGGNGIASSLSQFRTDLSDDLMQAAPGDTGALLSGLVTGDDGALSDSASTAFLESGTTHITAISGANFAVLTLLLGVMATGAMRRSLWFILIATGAICLYAAMVGAQPSALRAALLATAVLVGRWIGRIPDLLTLTILLAAAQILIRPNDFSTLAFQLSVAATLALIVVFDGRERLGGTSWPATLLLSVVAAQLATLPILASRIGTVSGVGLVANLIVGPLASLTFPIALVGGLVGRASPRIGDTLLLPAIWLGDVTIATVTWIGRNLPGSVQLGEPVTAANAVLAFVCWGAIVAMSGDLRRMGAHGARIIRDW
jgi:competence protein ComEC